MAVVNPYVVRDLEEASAAARAKSAETNRINALEARIACLEAERDSRAITEKQNADALVDGVIEGVRDFVEPLKDRIARLVDASGKEARRATGS